MQGTVYIVYIIPGNCRSIYSYVGVKIHPEIKKSSVQKNDHVRGDADVIDQE